MRLEKPSLKDARLYLDQLDLSYISRKMCSSSYSLPRWQPELAAICEKLYKRFLWLLVKYSDKHLVPTRDIDEFWHNHILYTQNYTNDCQALLGRYMHHSPFDEEANNVEEAQRLVDNFKLTQILYEQEFGESLQVLQKSKENERL